MHSFLYFFCLEFSFKASESVVKVLRFYFSPCGALFSFAAILFFLSFFFARRNFTFAACFFLLLWRFLYLPWTFYFCHEFSSIADTCFFFLSRVFLSSFAMNVFHLPRAFFLSLRSFFCHEFYLFYHDLFLFCREHFSFAMGVNHFFCSELSFFFFVQRAFLFCCRHFSFVASFFLLPRAFLFRRDTFRPP